jgi:hypothetical protein
VGLEKYRTPRVLDFLGLDHLKMFVSQYLKIDYAVFEHFLIVVVADVGMLMLGMHVEHHMHSDQVFPY